VTADLDGHRFNDDLLAGATDIAEARKRFPSLMHVLDHPELRQLFQRYDVPANAAKRQSRRWGVLAVLLGSLALIGAASTPLFHGLTENCARLVAFIAALSGLMSIFIGLRGVLWYRAKAEWLHRRLMTERLRQFHFQVFVCRLTEIIDSLTSEKAVEDYNEKRKAWFAEFKARMENGLIAEFTDLVADGAKKDIWLYTPCTPSTKESGSDSLNQIFDAYRELRIRHQLRYANYKLSQVSGIVPATAGTQMIFFSNVTLIGIAALVIIHLGIAISIAAGGNGFQPPPWVHVIAIWIAIVALAVRALEEGLQPARELERYRNYKAAVHAVLERFEMAKWPRERIEIMREMERLSFDEMVDFLKTHNEARFVM
jgi:hypothetical protein